MIYEIAFHLRTPLYELLDKMPYEELLGWLAYFDTRPVGWREDDRTYKLLQAQGVKEKGYNIFPSLGAIYNRVIAKDESGKLSATNLKASYLFHKMLSAKGGDKINYDD